MHNIRYIVAVGTSFTAGGGYEETNRNRPIIQKHTEDVIPASMFYCSWPGYLQRLVRDDVKVINLAMPGAGHDYLIRMTNEWIAKNPLKAPRTLFLLEISGLGRSEFWCNDLQQYVVCNWEYGRRKEKFFASLHTGQYWKDEAVISETLDKHEPLMEEWMNQFMDPIKFIDKTSHDMLNYMCKMKYKGFHFRHFGEMFPDPYLAEEQIVKDNALYLHDDIMKYSSIHTYLDVNKLTIRDWTKGEVDDFHACLLGNKIIACQYYAQLKDDFNI